MNSDYSPTSQRQTDILLNQLYEDWGDFLLDATQPASPEQVNSINPENNGRKAVIGLDDVDNERTDVLVPIPVNTLKFLLSSQGPCLPNVKSQVFEEIKKNLDLNKDSRRLLKRLLFSDRSYFDSSCEISDFPSPRLPPLSRNSAPARLKTKLKRNPQSHVKENAVFEASVHAPVRNAGGLQKNATSNGADDRQSSAMFATCRRKMKEPKPTIVCTYFQRSDLVKIYRVVKKLGYFEVENHVSNRTTHLIVNSSKKTVNLCKAIARGCWILNDSWVTKSLHENRWLYEERFERIDLSPAIKENRIRRQQSGGFEDSVCNVLSEFGPIYVSEHCRRPARSDVCELIGCANGCVTSLLHEASVVIGPLPTDTGVRVRCVHESWIVHSLVRGVALPLSSFILDTA